MFFPIARSAGEAGDGDEVGEPDVPTGGVPTGTGDATASGRPDARGASRIPTGTDTASTPAAIASTARRPSGRRSRTGSVIG